MSMDEIDVANEHIERELEQRIKAARSAKPTPETIHCMNCGEPTERGSRFCCKDCAEDFEHRARQNKRAGVR